MKANPNICKKIDAAAIFGENPLMKNCRKDTKNKPNGTHVTARNWHSPENTDSTKKIIGTSVMKNRKRLCARGAKQITASKMP